MQVWITNIIESYGYLSIALLIAIENIFPPIPSELILTFGGFMTTKTDMNVWLVSLFATFGSVAGAIILYFVGRLLSPQRLEWVINKFGRILRLKMSDIEKAESWFNKRGGLTVFFCRFIPIIRSLISIPAGMAKMHFGKFLILTTIGTAIWNIVLVNLGAFAGESWQKIDEYMGTYSHIAYVIIGIAFVGFVLFWFLRKKKTEEKN